MQTHQSSSVEVTAFEAAFDNIFELQDQVASGVSEQSDPEANWKPKIARVENEKRRQITMPMTASLRASALIHQWTTEGRGEALRLFYKGHRVGSRTTGELTRSQTMCYCWRKVDGTSR